MPSTETEEKAKAAEQAPPITKWAALKARGWIQPVDYFFMILTFGTLITMLFWRIFGTPAVLNMVACLLVIIFLFQFWLVILVYRCACFVIETQADINLMPEAAARIVASYYSGGPRDRAR
jgi:uncharacterized RDD family membrane protein YckC